MPLGCSGELQKRFTEVSVTLMMRLDTGPEAEGWILH